MIPCQHDACIRAFAEEIQAPARSVMEYSTATQIFWVQIPVSPRFFFSHRAHYMHLHQGRQQATKALKSAALATR